MFVHLIKVSSDMLFNKISRYLQFKISTMLTIHFAPDYISSFVSAYSCLGPSLIPGAILACVWLKSECRGGRMQKMMCCIDSVDCYIDIADIAAHSDTDSISHSGGKDGALQPEKNGKEAPVWGVAQFGEMSKSE